jgi:hypothetical protein
MKFYEHKRQEYTRITEPAILLVGGSNLLYGVDTNKMGSKMGVPVYNFGLGASIGLDVMLELSGSVPKEGDTIILSLENELLYTNPYTMKGRVINDLTVSALHNDLNLIEKLRAAWMAPWGASFSSLKDGKSERFNKIYRTSSLTATGDLKEGVLIDNWPANPFPSNQMTGIYNLNPTNTSILKRFIADMSALNVKVYAVPAARYVKDKTPKIYYKNEDALLTMYQNMGIDYLSNVTLHSFRAEDMYDSPNHLNQNARERNTNRLIKALLPLTEVALARNETSTAVNIN